MQGTWIEGSEGERYLVRQELGRGGMGVVLLADQAPQGQRVVLKVLLNQATAPRLERFAREGAVAAKLQHPGIVPVRRIGRLSDGRPYLAFEHVEGAHDLRGEFLNAPLERRLQWLMEAGAALGHAHHQGIVHRDLKLANLLVDAGGRVRVADFGVALLSAEDRLTQTGALVGTVHTMAPEQATGERGSVGPASDVWALGVLLYLACSGRYPFESKVQVEVLAQIVAAKPPPLQGVSPALAGVCFRALHRDPAQRYPNGAEFADALELATLAPQAGSSRTPLWIAAAALGGFLLALPLAFWARREPAPAASPTPSASEAPAASPSPSPPPDAAALLLAAQRLASAQDPQAEAAYLEAAAAGSLPAMEWLAHEGAEAQRVSWRQKAAEAGSPRAALALGHSLRTSEPTRARSWLRRAAKGGSAEAMVLLSTSLRDPRAGPVDPGRAQEWFDRALAEQEPLALYVHGQALFRRGDHAEGARYVKQSAEGEFALAWVALGRWTARGWGGAPPDLPEAERLLRRGLELGHPDAAAHLASVLHSQGQVAESDRLLLEGAAAGDRLCQALRGRHLYYYSGRKAEGLRLLREAAQGNPDHPWIKFWLAHALSAAGQRDEALTYALGATRGGVSLAKLLVAELWSRRGAKQEATELLKEALREGVATAALALSSQASDPREQARYLKVASELHDPTALVLFSRRSMSAKRYEEGRQYLVRATAGGNVRAHHLLAHFYARGIFGTPDLPAAERHWRIAARRGHLSSVVSFARLVSQRPESPSLEEAKALLEAAAERGDADATSLRASLGW